MYVLARTFVTNFNSHRPTFNYVNTTDVGDLLRTSLP